MAKPASRPPPDLLAAFKALEQPTDIAVLLIDDGFDAVLVRVLGAFEKANNRWDAPKRLCPDAGRPTPAAWDWLVSGWLFDYESISRGADISRDQTRERIAVLVQSRLIYPDGSISSHARKAITATVRQRLQAGSERGGRKGKKNDDDPGSAKAN